MVAAPQFNNLLEILGGVDLELVEDSKNWNFYTVKFRTPAGEMTAPYLYLAANCPYTEDNSKNLSIWRGNGPYTVVTTTKSRLSNDLTRTADEFGARFATTPRRLLIDNLLQTVDISPGMAEDFKYFVEPEASYTDNASPAERSVPALTHFVKSLLSVQQENYDSVCAEILVAPAGQGKTTLCRAIASKIRSSYPDTIPVLVESNQWQSLIDLTLPNILSAALLKMIPGATQLADPKVFQLLTREKILVPIFDGFDELSLHPNPNFSAATLLTELLGLVGGAEVKVLVTVREAFWEKHVNGIPESSTKMIQRFDLQGFSNKQGKRFFHKRLKNQEERDIANRLSSEMGSKLYERAVERPHMHADRASGVPLMLELIALYVDGNSTATFAPQSQDPLGPLLEAVCERENARQKLGISSQKQMLIFEKVFRDYQDDIPREELALYVEDFVPEVTKDKIDRFESHAFLSTTAQNRVVPRFETLRVYFVARWLANQLEGAVDHEIGREATRLLASHASGSSNIFEFLVERFANDSREKVYESISHACRMVSRRSG